MLTSYAYIYENLIENKKLKLGSMIANLLLTIMIANVGYLYLSQIKSLKVILLWIVEKLRKKEPDVPDNVSSSILNLLNIKDKKVD